MIAEDGFLEHAEYVGNLYGTPREPVMRMLDEGIDVFLEIEIKGYLQVKRAYPDCVTIFIAPPSFEELERRLIGRGTETDEEIADRLVTARDELSYQDSFNYVVVNDSVDRAVEEILSIISKIKSKR